MRQVDSLERFYQAYNDLAEFFVVYIREAHAADSSRPAWYAVEKGITEPKTYEERCSVAEMLIKEKKLTIPCLVDNMDNEVNMVYKGSPTRIFLIKKDGRLGVAGSRGPFGLGPAFEEVQKWMKSYKETGQEPISVK